MSFHYETEKREFVRIQTEIPVRYKFLSRTLELDCETIFEGVTSDISANGMMLYGKVPTVSCIPALLMHEIVIGLHLLVPTIEEPVKVLAQVSWVEAFEKGAERCALGLRFEEIAKEHQDELLKYVIKLQLAH